MKNNFDHNSLWIGNNMDVLRNINSECVDLIYLDPPARPKHRFILPLLTSVDSSGGGEQAWAANDIDIHELEEMAEQNPKVHETIEKVPDRETRAYLIFLAPRLLECQRILRPTGSVYLHCSEDEATILKPLMDAAFGKENFLDSIEWRRSTLYRRSRKRKPTADRLLFYAKMEAEHMWTGPRLPRSEKEIEARYPYEDPDKGRFAYEPITSAGAIEGQSPAKFWKGYNIAEIGKCWSPPTAGPYADYLDRWIIPGYKAKDLHAKLDALDKAELIGHFPHSTEPQLIRLADADPGKIPQGAVWDTPKMKSFAVSQENQKYPAQKPLALIERVIRNSSKRGDIVFDIFSGSATTCVAASRLDRRWAGCDISYTADKIFRERMFAEQGLFFDYRGPADLPVRKDTKTLLNYKKHRERLYCEQAGICKGCNKHFKIADMSGDHKIPLSRGGNDHPNNLQLLCLKCNSSKGDRTMAEWKAAKSAKSPS